MGKARHAWVTLLPLTWILIVTMSAGYQKLFSPLPRLGFLAHARVLEAARDGGKLPAGVASTTDLGRMIANDYLDAAVAAFFLLAVIVVIADSAREWHAVLVRGTATRSTETAWDGVVTTS